MHDFKVFEAIAGNYIYDRDYCSKKLCPNNSLHFFIISRRKYFEIGNSIGKMSQLIDY